MTDRPILVTGAAGFIGFHTATALLERGEAVVGIDNLNDYYAVELKKDRLALLTANGKFHFRALDIEDGASLAQIFSGFRPRFVINLAAQVGVRNSLDNPLAYVRSNVVGFLNILEACRQYEVEHLVYASSSSVYGTNSRLPFSTTDCVDHPISIYAATKKTDELMAHVYSHLYQLPSTGLRFFTVYGPWGRPDMAMFLFTKALFEGAPIRLFNGGKMLRDFTYVQDVVAGLLRVMDRPPSSAPQTADSSPFSRIYNIGNHTPVEISHVIEALECLTGRKANIEVLPMQPGEVPATFADVDDLVRDTGFQPATPIEEGAAQFVEWYRDYYKVPAFRQN